MWPISVGATLFMVTVRKWTLSEGKGIYFSPAKGEASLAEALCRAEKRWLPPPETAMAHE